MQIDRTKFFAGYSAAFGAASQGQTEGLNALLQAAEGDTQITDLRWLAYMLATVKHECADRWKPIEEFGKGKGMKYGNPVTVTDPATGQSFTNVYYGRGYVQLTWKDNYEAMGRALNNRLLYEPQLALDAVVAYKIMSLGMRKGSFTGKKLSDYIAGDKADYVNARKIINGLDQAQRIAGYATKLESILRASVVAAVDGVPVIPTPQPATPTTPASAASGGFFKVTASSLNVREGASASAPSVDGSPLRQGAIVQGVADIGGWKLIIADGADVTGWASAQYLAPVSVSELAQAPVPAPVFTVAASSLNVRSGPGAANPTVAGSPLTQGAVVHGVGDQDGWKKIVAEGSGVIGWVSAQYLQPAVPQPA